jgi:hypothetical protein
LQYYPNTSIPSFPNDSPPKGLSKEFCKLYWFIVRATYQSHISFMASLSELYKKHVLCYVVSVSCHPFVLLTDFVFNTLFYKYIDYLLAILLFITIFVILIWVNQKWHSSG